MYVHKQCYPPLQQLHSNFGGNFSSELCQAMKITVAKSDPVMELFTTLKN